MNYFEEENLTETIRNDKLRWRTATRIENKRPATLSK